VKAGEHFHLLFYFSAMKCLMLLRNIFYEYFFRSYLLKRFLFLSSVIVRSKIFIELLTAILKVS